AAEALSLPVWAVRSWLGGDTETNIADLEGSAFQNGLAKPRNAKGPVLAWKGAENNEVISDPDKIAPGATICVPAAYGGCDEWGWSPASSEQVRDIADAVKLRTGRPILRLHGALAETW